MPFDAFGNYIPDDEAMSLDAMQYELAKKGSMPLRPDGSDVPYLASEVPSLRVPVTPKEPPKPYSTAKNFPQAVADRLGISALPQALMAIATDFPAAVASELGYKDTAKAIQYEPTSRIANQMLEVAEQAPRVITGSHMGFGPLAETWTTPIRGISPEDVRVMGKRAIETGRELRAIPEDFANAQSGITRQNYMGEPTYGAKLQSVADDIGDVLARQQARRSSYETSPRSSVEVFGDMVPDSRMYAVRNTGEGQMLRPTTSKGGVEPRNVDYGDTEQFLSELAPPLSVNKPEEIIDMYESLYMSANTPANRRLNEDWEKFQRDKVAEMYPSHFTKADSFKAFRTGYPANVIQDMKLKWLHEYVEQKKAEGFDIPSMDEYFARAQAASTLTRKIAPNLIQKYIGTPDDPFLKSALQGITMNPADEFVEQFLTPQGSLQTTRKEAGFESLGEVGGKLMPVAESKLAAQNAELDKLIADQVVVGRVEGMVVPYPDGRIDPDTGEVMLATNPNYAQYSNKIGAMRKAIEDTEEEIRKLQIAQSYENVSDASIKMKTATEFRNRIPPEEQQFFPALFNEKEKRTSISPTEYVTPDDALLFQTSAEGLKRAGILPLTKTLVEKIMSGEIPPDQVPNLAQPQTITKFMKNIVAPRIEKEKAARLAMKDYKVNVEKHFLEVLKTIPDSMKVGTNAKLLWIDDTTPEAEINQHLSDETFVLDHCIGNSGHGGGLKNLFTGDERGYIPYLDPATKQKFKNASGTSSYMDAVLQGEKDIMMIRDDTTGMPVGTIELDREVGKDGDIEYRIGYVSGYKNHNNKFKGIDPKYREALRDSLNMVKDSVVNTGDNEVQSGVYDMFESNQVERMKGKLEIPGSSSNQRAEAWEAIKKNIMDTLDGDRYITIDQAEQAVKEYKQANPPVPAVRQAQPDRASIEQRNIIMQGLSRENLDTSRQFNAARIVGNGGDRFLELPFAQNNMDPRPYQAYLGLLQSENRRADAVRGISDYELFRNLQSYVDQIDDGSLRFGDFNLGGHSELLDLRDGIQKHADAIGQLAHYADVLQRNGYRSPLPSEQTGAPEWQTYQRYIGELGIDNPSDLRTRLLDTINHGDLREIDPQLDEIQRVNLRHLLEIHERAVKQAMDYPAPTAPAQQRGIPLRDYETLTQNTMAQIGADFGDGTRQEVGRIMADAIAYQMDVPANERPVQLSNYLTSQARDAVNPVAVRNALRVMAGALDQANADIQNARNAPAPTTALPTVTQYGEAVDAGRQTMSPYQWADVEEILNNIQNEINREGGLYYQHPARIITRLNEQAQLQDVGGEPDTAQGLRNLAGQMARLVPANPPASMALANQNAQQRNPTRQLVVGREALSNSIIDAINDEPILAPSISDRLNALQWRENLVNDPAGLIRNIRIEADAEARAANDRFATSLYDIANLIADENGETLFTPAGRELQAPTESSLDIAMTTEGQRNTNRVEQVVALREGIDRQLEEISDSGRGALLSLIDFYRNPNQLPDSITDHTNRYDDAVRIADYLRRHAQARLDAMPQERAIPTAAMLTPRDVAMSIAPDSTHQSLVQRQRQVELLTEGINDQIRSLPTTDEPALREALEFYRDYDNLPTDMMARIPSEEDAERVLSHIRQHIENRIASLPENRGQGRQVEREGFFNRLNHIIDDTILTASNNPTYANMQDMPTVLEREINSYHQNSENLPQFIQYLRDDAASVETNVLGDEWHQNYVTEIRHLIDRIERLQRDMPQMAMSLTFHQDAEPAQLPAPARDVDQQIEGFRNAVASRAQAIEAAISPEASQSFLNIVDMARNEYDPITNPSGFTRSLSHRAYSVRNNQAYADMAEPLANELFSFAREYNQQPTPALPAPVDNGNNFEQMRRIEDAITNRGLIVNQNHLGSSQQFDTLVQATRRQFNPLVDTVNFINSLHERANSVDRVGNREAQILANQLRHLAADVNEELTRQAPTLPAPTQPRAMGFADYVQQAYDTVSQEIRRLHSYMIDDVQRNPLTRANLTDVIRNDLDRYGLSGSAPEAVDAVLTRIRNDGIAPAIDPVAQHYNRIEQGVNQPQGLGALDRNDSDLVRLLTTDFLNGDRNALTQLSPVQREMAEVLTRSREVEPTVINELDHRRLINTLVSQTYNPATDGEALIRLAETRAGMFAGLDEAQQAQVVDIVNKWNFLRFPRYRPPEEGMGLEPEGRKRGGFIRKRKMNEGGTPPKLTPYEQFKIDNAERIRQGQEDIANRNKYDPYKGTDRPIPTQRGASGSAGTTSGAGPSNLIRPRVYAIGGKAYMEIGGQVKPVPNVPATPEKTRPNTTDHTTRKPADKGFPEILERIRNTPKPSGSAGTMPSGSGPSYLDKPSLYASGGRIRMSEGGAPDLSMYAPRIQELVRTGQIPLSDASWMNEYAKTKGDPRAETSKGMHKDLSEKYQNFYDRIRSGEIPDPYKATPKATTSPKGGSGGGGGGGMDTNLSRPYERNLPYKDGGNVNIDAMRLALMKG